MSLSNLLGDDEHTAADGPYKRIMKTRKWLYLTATVGLLIAGGRYNQEAGTKILLEVFSLPDFVFAMAILFGLAYLIPQYAILSSQLVDVYSAVLDERMADQRLERLREVMKRHLAASEELDRWVLSWRKSRLDPLVMAEEKALSRLSAANKFVDMKASEVQIDTPEMSEMWQSMDTEELQQFLRESDDYRLQWIIDHIDRVQKQYQISVEARIEAQNEDPPESDSRYKLLQDAVKDASSDLANLDNVRAYLSSGYRKKEILIDIIRIVPPALTGVAAFAALIFKYSAPIAKGVLGI